MHSQSTQDESLATVEVLLWTSQGKNFTNAEKDTLKELLLKHPVLTGVVTVSAGEKITKAKEREWEALAAEFNKSSSSVCPRTSKQLKKLWDNIKSERKKTLAADKQQRFQTGGGIRITEVEQDGSLNIYGLTQNTQNPQKSF